MEGCRTAHGVRPNLFLFHYVYIFGEGRICGSHSDGYEEYYLLGYNAV
jgi:hypothetical protein